MGTNELPDIIEPLIEMEEPNEVIFIREGLFILTKKNVSIKLEGTLKFYWFPRIEGLIKGKVIEKIDMQLELGETYNVEFEKMSLGECYVIGNETNFNDRHNIKALMKGTILIGDETIPVNKIHFELPNFRDFSGMSVQQIAERERRFFKNRLLLQDDKYEIVIDKRSDYNELYKKLEDLGGFLNVCAGYILKKNGSLTFSEYQKVSEMLSQFLNFLNGNRTSILFAKGTADSTMCWEDFSPNSVGLYKYVISWIPRFNLSKISDLYFEFSRLWRTDEQMLTIAIHWYIEANCNSAFVEGSITMIQNALELLYNWLIVEKLKIIKGEDSRNMSASNKIRILLSKINVESSIPKQLDKLIKTAEKKSDGPEIFTQIRNAIVHSQEEKRQKIYNLEPGIKFQALTLGIWYVELILLFILNYTGDYYNRCSLTPTQKGVETVPWAK